MERALPSDDFVIPIYLTLQFERLPYISAYSALLVTFPLSNLWKVVLYEITASLCLFFYIVLLFAASVSFCIYHYFEVCIIDRVIFHVLVLF